MLQNTQMTSIIIEKANYIHTWFKVVVIISLVELLQPVLMIKKNL